MEIHRLNSTTAANVRSSARGTPAGPSGQQEIPHGADEVVRTEKTDAPAAGIHTLPRRPHSGTAAASASAQAASAATASTLTGPTAQPLGEQLKALSEKSVAFVWKRRVYIPLVMSPFKEISPEKAEKVLTAGKEKDRARLSVTVDEGSKVPLRDAKGVNELMAFTGADAGGPLTRNDLAEFLKQAEKDGHTVRTPDGKTWGAFAAYKELTGDAGQPVEIWKKGVRGLSVTRSTMGDVPALEKDLQAFRDVFKKFGDYYADVVAQVMEPLGGSHLNERLAVMEGLQRSFYGSESAAVFSVLREQVEKGADFGECGRLAIAMVDANPKNLNRTEARIGIELIAARLAAHPDEQQAFLGLVKGGTPPSAAKKIFDLLPQPVKDGDFTAAAAAFAKGGSWGSHDVELIMKLPADASYEDRIAIMRGVESHIQRYSDDRSPFELLTREIDSLAKHAKSGAELTKLGKLYVEMLDAYGSTEWCDAYPRGLDFIARRLHDRPSEFTAFCGALKSEVGIFPAVKVFDCLPQPVKDGDYEKTLAHFKGDKWWKDFKVEEVMKPVEGTTLPQRIDVLKELRNHLSYDEEIFNDYKTLRAKAADGAEFLKSAELYGKLLDHCSSHYRNEQYGAALDFVQGRLKDHPQEFAVCESLVKSGLSMQTAKAVFDNLPKPVKDGDYAEAAKRFEGDKTWNPGRVAFVMKPAGDATLDDRITLMRGLERHITRYHDDTPPWNLMVKDYEALQKKGANGPGFVALGKLYLEMLDAYGQDEWCDAYPHGLDFITRRLHDRPSEFTAFCEVLKSGVGIYPAAKVFDCLPQPVKDGDYEKTLAHFNGDKWWKDFKVEEVMKPVEGTTLPQRIDVLKELRNHLSYDEEIFNDYKTLRAKAADGAEFLKSAELYGKLLDHCSSHYRNEQYGAALDFVQERLKDRPDEFAVCESLVKSGLSMQTAKAVFDGLPKPVKDGDYAEAAKRFEGDKTWSPGRVAFVMKPAGDATLDDRIALMRGLEKHITRYHDDTPPWSLMVKDYEALQKSGATGPGFAALGRLYVEMLDAYGQNEWGDAYRHGLDFIARRLHAHPSEFTAFCGALKSELGVYPSTKAFDCLPQPVKDGDYEKTLALFTDGTWPKWWKAASVEATMQPVAGATLQERVNLMKTIGENVYHDQSIELYRAVQKETAATGKFVDTGKVIARIIKECDIGSYGEGAEAALPLVHATLLPNPEKLESFIRLGKEKRNLSRACAAFELIQAPVKDEPYEARENAVRSLMKYDNYAKAYSIAAKHIFPGETIEDSSRLLSHIIAGAEYGSTWDDYENLLTGILEKKGTLTGSQVARMFETGAFTPKRTETLLQGVELLGAQVKGESFEEREKALFAFFEKIWGNNSSSIGESMKLYTFIREKLLENESLGAAAERFLSLRTLLTEALVPKSRYGIKLEVVQDAFTFLSDGAAKGLFGTLTIDQATALLIKDAAMEGSLDKAKSALLHRFEATEKHRIEAGAEAVKIAGVTLKKKK